MFWCDPDCRYDPILFSPDSKNLVEKFRNMNGGSNWHTLDNEWSNRQVTEEQGHRLFTKHSKLDLGTCVISRKCSLFSLKVTEGDIAWDLFWQVDSALKFSGRVMEMTSLLQAGVNVMHAKPNLEKGVATAAPTRSCRNSRQHCPEYVVLDLRIERDWYLHCRRWMSLNDKIFRDNCMNNSQEIHNTLLSEGIPRMSSIYVSTALSRRDMLRPEHGLQGLFKNFNVVTKDSILQNIPNNWALKREWWAAVDSAMATDATTFVGNSVSIFSAYMILSRHFRGQQAWHYNGGAIPLVESGVIRPRQRTSLATFRQNIKWVFAYQEGSSALSKSFAEMLKVAVLSAKRHTNLIPVCVTTLPPSSELSVWMTLQGVRVLYHEPRWAKRLAQIVEHYTRVALSMGLTGNEKSHLSTDTAAMIGTFLRIDIPIIGLLDEFVLYTDIDVMFTGPVTWKHIFPQVLSMETLKSQNDFARGKFAFGEPANFGVPKYFAVSSEMDKRLDPNYMNAGVMLLNMRNLRATHTEFLAFIYTHAQRTGSLNWPSGPGDQGAFREFYKLNREDGKVVYASLLPFRLNWKSYWEPSYNSSIVHFHGPKCRQDILPYYRSGILAVPQFKKILKMCRVGGNCLALCQTFETYLERPS